MFADRGMLHSQTTCEWDLQVRAASSDEQCLRPFLRRPSRQRGNLTFELPARHQVTKAHTHMTSILDTFTSPPCNKFFPFVCFWEPPHLAHCGRYMCQCHAAFEPRHTTVQRRRETQKQQRLLSLRGIPHLDNERAIICAAFSNSTALVRHRRNQAAVSSREVEITLLVI